MGPVSSNDPVPISWLDVDSYCRKGKAEERYMSNRCALVRERFDIEVMFHVEPISGRLLSDVLSAKPWWTEIGGRSFCQ